MPKNQPRAAICETAQMHAHLLYTRRQVSLNFTSLGEILKSQSLHLFPRNMVKIFKNYRCIEALLKTLCRLPGGKLLPNLITNPFQHLVNFLIFNLVCTQNICCDHLNHCPYFAYLPWGTFQLSKWSGTMLLLILSLLRIE